MAELETHESVCSVSLRWPKAETLQALLASELLSAWLKQAIEQAAVLSYSGASTPVDSSSEEFSSKLIRPWLPSSEIGWPEWCERRGIEVSCLQPAIHRHQLLKAWKQHHYASAAHQEYLELGPQLDQVCFSILQTKDAHLAQEWYFKLRDEDASFNELAPLSMGAEKKTAGRLGPMLMRDLQNPIDRLLSRATPAQVQQPLRIPSGRSIVVRLDQRQPAQWDNSTCGLLIEGLHRRWLGEVIEDLRQLQPLPGAVCSIPLP